MRRVYRELESESTSSKNRVGSLGCSQVHRRALMAQVDPSVPQAFLGTSGIEPTINCGNCKPGRTGHVYVHTGRLTEKSVGADIMCDLDAMDTAKP